jgi:rhodanese-related sulfurtransferase
LPEGGGNAKEPSLCCQQSIAFDYEPQPVAIVGKGHLMYGLFGRSSIQDLTPEEVSEGLAADKIMLVDVREPNETARERIRGAVLAPLSQFDPIDLPDPQGRLVVFTCASGIRSIKAAEIAQAAGLPYDAHLAGGIKSWKAAGLPVET